MCDRCDMLSILRDLGVPGTLTRMPEVTAVLGFDVEGEVVWASDAANDEPFGVPIPEARFRPVIDWPSEANFEALRADIERVRKAVFN